jgi:hypothetical protein
MSRDSRTTGGRARPLGAWHLLAAGILTSVETLALTACERVGQCPESMAVHEPSSIRCPRGEYLARVCAPEPDGPCTLRCVQPLAPAEPSAYVEPPDDAGEP